MPGGVRTLIATLMMSQPGWLAVALVGACVAAAVSRAMRRSVAPACSRWCRVRGAVGAIAVAAGAGVIGVWLTHVGGTRADAALAVVALAAGVWLVSELYQWHRPEAGARRVILIAVRVCAWAVLLLLLGRPAWESIVVAWDKPVLAVVLDHSSSMALSDRTPSPTTAASRAELANQALSKSRKAIERIGELYDVRLLRVGVRPATASDWAIVPQAPGTALGAALRDTRELRSARGRPPVAVLLISDGAENVADNAAVRQAADDLASQRTALLAVGVGPEPGQTPLVELEPLVVPPRVGVHDVLHVTATGRVQGCRGHPLRTEVVWDEDVSVVAPLAVDYDAQQISPAFDVSPPGPGAHRLSVRVSLPPALGGQRFATSAVVDVVADRVRVLYIEQVPRTESAFIARAWRGDEALEITQQFLFDDDVLAKAAREGGEVFSGYDVVMIGRVRGRIQRSVLETLVRTVTERGAGLLLAGGSDLFNRDEYAATPLGDICPVDFVLRGSSRNGQPRFIPTEAGLRHPILQGVAATPDDRGASPRANERGLWERLPPLGGAAPLGTPRPAAVVLAADEMDRPLLVAQEAGRGRCVAAGWESTWPWALASDEGSEVHRRMWRKLVVWLANRRPRAWVVPDQGEYALAMLAGGERRVRVRAGVAALEALVPAAPQGALRVSLTLRRADESDSQVKPTAVALTPNGAEWTAQLPDPGTNRPALAAGTYLLEFQARIGDGSAAATASITEEELTAQARFLIVAEDIEKRVPNADLALLRDAAERTRASGGNYREVARLPELLDELGRQDRRDRVETPARYELLTGDPWGLLLWLVAAVGVEWAVRKRSGMA